MAKIGQTNVLVGETFSLYSKKLLMDIILWEQVELLYGSVFQVSSFTDQFSNWLTVPWELSRQSKKENFVCLTKK